MFVYIYVYVRKCDIIPPFVNFSEQGVLTMTEGELLLSSTSSLEGSITLPESGRILIHGGRHSINGNNLICQGGELQVSFYTAFEIRCANVPRCPTIVERARKGGLVNFQRCGSI